MNCPFLQEARMRRCHAAGIRKMLMQTAPSEGERCSTPAYTQCGIYQIHPVADAPAGQCPYLHESAVQFCAAAPMARPVPYSESTLIRCGSSGHRYCEVYLGFVNAGHAVVDEITAPDHLSYTANHMWIDVGEDGCWRIGIDALLAHALGRAESVTFLTEGGAQRPAAVLTAAGAEVSVVFPHVVNIAACNTYLRADPARLTTSPYRQGWLFRGDTAPGLMSDLIPAGDASRWMKEEVHRASEFAHARTAEAIPGLAADGGILDRGFLGQLRREDRLRFCDAFFSPWAARTTR